MKTNAELKVIVNKIEKQIKNHEGIIKELKRDRSGSSKQSTKDAIDKSIRSHEGIIKELKRDLKGTREQIW